MFPKERFVVFALNCQDWRVFNTRRANVKKGADLLVPI
jgi:hypothetical protein